MTEENKSTETEKPIMTPQQEYELKEQLKTEATELGLSFGPNTGIPKLQAMIDEHKLSNPNAGKKPKLDANAPRVKVNEEKYLSNSSLRNRRINRARKLIRVRITCLNTLKSQWKGEIFTFANDDIVLRRMVPFNKETHVEQALLNMIKNRKYRPQIAAEKGKTTDSTIVPLVPEFGVVELDPLSPEELKSLGEQQMAAESA